MDIILNENMEFKHVNFSEKTMEKSEFINCIFIGCNFSKSDMSGTDFMDCTFFGCNLSLAVVENCSLKNLTYNNCKILGIDFSRSNDFLFLATYNHSIIDYCSFYQKKMKKVVFDHCSLKEVDFTEVDLSGAIFKNCDLLHATFLRSNLEKADFTSAYNCALDLALNKVKKAKFSMAGLPGLLSKYQLDLLNKSTG